MIFLALSCFNYVVSSYTDAGCMILQVGVVLFASILMSLAVTYCYQISTFLGINVLRV